MIENSTVFLTLQTKEDAGDIGARVRLQLHLVDVFRGHVLDHQGGAARHLGCHVPKKGMGENYVLCTEGNGRVLLI